MSVSDGMNEAIEVSRFSQQLLGLLHEKESAEKHVDELEEKLKRQEAHTKVASTEVASLQGKLEELGRIVSQHPSAFGLRTRIHLDPDTQLLHLLAELHSRGLAHNHSRTRVFMTAASCLLLLTGIFPERYANDVSNVVFAERTVDRHRIHYLLHMGGVCAAVAVLVGLPFFWALFITGSAGDAQLDAEGSNRSISTSAQRLIRLMSVRLSAALTRGGSRRRVGPAHGEPEAPHAPPAAADDARVLPAALGLSRPLVWARVVHVAVLLVYTGCFFVLVEHADTSDYCSMLQHEYARRGLAHTAQLADACARWPQPANTTASACTSFSADVLPSYTCRYVTFTLSAAESQLVDFGLGFGVRERGACRKHGCLLFQNARSVALEFGLLLLSFTYYASYGLNDLQRLFNAKASVQEAFNERVRTVADAVPRVARGGYGTATF